jgi:Flp pilus assembly protein TadG
MSMTAFLMLTLAIINMGSAIYAYNWVAYSAREATRYASVHGSTSSSPVGPSSYSALTSVVTNIANGLTGTVSVTPTWSSNSNVPGNTVNVKVQYQFSFVMPFMTLSPITLSSTSQMVIDR